MNLYKVLSKAASESYVVARDVSEAVDIWKQTYSRDGNAEPSRVELVSESVMLRKESHA